MIVLWLIGLMMRYLDRLANAVNLWKLAEDRQAARKAALTATKAADRRQALAVLDSLQRQPSPERTSLDRRRTKPTR